MTYHEEFENNGFCIRERVFSDEIIESLSEYCDTLRPQRGHTKSKGWIGWKQASGLADPRNDVDWAYYWTDEVSGHMVNTVKDELSPIANEILGEHNWVWYHADFIVLYPGMNFTRPHIDTPYRFSEFKYSSKDLGVQFMIPLSDINEHNGATAYVPNTHNYIIDSQYIANNRGWDTFFLDNYKQFSVPKGSIVSWNPRLMHSTMPNHSSEIRKLLLIHASEKNTARRLRTVDPTTNPTLRN